MKKAIATIGALALLGGGAMVLSDNKNPGDEARARALLEGMTAEQLTADPAPVNAAGPADLDDEKMAAVFEEFKNPEVNGGLAGIAHRHKCSLAQVRLLKRLRDERLDELQEAQAEPIEK